MVVISNENSCSVANRFVCVVFMRPIAILHVTSSFMIFGQRWIPRFPPSFVATSTRFSIGQLTSLVRTHLTCRVSFSSLRDLFDAFCIVDIWRYLHPSSSSFSWTRWDGSRASRIDLCGIPYVWVSSVLSCDLLPCPFSDHCGLLTVVSVPDVVPPGPGSSTFLSCRSRRMSF